VSAEGDLVTHQLRIVGVAGNFQPLDPLAIAAVALVMLVVSLAAALAPAWRAARVDPAEALRAE